LHIVIIPKFNLFFKAQSFNGLNFPLDKQNNSAYDKGMKKILILFLFLALIGCGRISKPQSPKDSTYPEVYIVRD